VAHDQALNGDVVRLGVLTVLEEWLLNPKSAVLDGKALERAILAMRFEKRAGRVTRSGKKLLGGKDPLKGPTPKSKRKHPRIACNLQCPVQYHHEQRL